EDSDLRRLRRRVYSSFPLAARAHPRERAHCSLDCMERFDAVVVGAGPGGSTAAHRLARAGVSVLLLDKARFPRDKPCGGGLTLRAVKELPFSVEPVVEDVVRHVECRLNYNRSFTSGDRDLALMTERRRLEQFLLERGV